jgi:hypothetical protein
MFPFNKIFSIAIVVLVLFFFFSFSRWGWPLDWILSHSNTHDNNQFRRELISLPIELFWRKNELDQISHTTPNMTKWTKT